MVKSYTVINDIYKKGIVMIPFFHYRINIMIPCKVCESERKDEIEKMIFNGETNNAIANKLRATGMDISHASIKRHKERHIQDKETIAELSTPKHNVKHDRHNDLDITINTNEIFKQIKETTKVGDYETIAENYAMINLMLNRIVNNQLAITIALQENYMESKAKYPHEQIRGLQIVQDLMQKFELFNRSSFQHHKDIFEEINYLNYLEENGYKAKIKLIYNKGDIFKLALKYNDSEEAYKEYENKFKPKNPYIETVLDLYRNKSRTAFDKGIKKATSEIETIDTSIFYMLSKCEDKIYNEWIKRLSIENYNAIENYDYIESNLYSEETDE